MRKIKLSPYAQTFYTEWKLSPSSSIYNIVLDQVLYGDLDIDRLSKALKRYVSEVVVLNSHIQEVNSDLYWVPNDSIHELEYLDSPVSKSELLSFVRESFNLNSGPLYRFRLIKIKNGVYRFIIVLHHLVEDGLSLNSGVFEALSNYYNNAQHVAEYSITEQVSLISKLDDVLNTKINSDQNKYKVFWKEKLSNFNNIDFSFLCLDDSSSEYKTDAVNAIEEIRFSYSKSDLLKLNSMKDHLITPYMYSMLVFALLLYRYSGQEKFVIAYPVAIKEGADFIYGAQLNTSLFPYRFRSDMTVLDLLKQMLRFVGSLRKDRVNYHYCPVANIILDGNKHFMDAFFIQTNLRDKKLNFENINKVEVLSELYVDAVTKGMLLFEQEEHDTGIDFRVRFDASFFHRILVENFVANYKKLFNDVLEDLINKRDRLVSRYDFIDHKQFHEIVCDLNNTEKSYPLHRTIHSFFEEQAAENPNSIALVFEGEQMTYQELNDRANKLARYFRQIYRDSYGCNFKPDSLIVLYLERSLEMVIAILAVLKAGSAYVPIEVGYSEDKINYILNDTASRIIVTQKDFYGQLNSIIKQFVKENELKNNNFHLVAIDDKLIEREMGLLSVNNLKPIGDSASLAYILYTSGTTGKPKGVMVEHRSVVNIVLSLYDVYDFQPREKSTFFTSYMFDVSVSEIFIAFFQGAELHVLSREVKLDAFLISHYIQANDINYVYLPPALLAVLPRLNYKNLKGIVYAGEPCNKEVGKYWSERYPLYNYYGPTESTIYSLGKRVVAGDVHLIGRSVANIKSYILDDNLLPVPVGVVGTLYLGGVGLARGYLNRSELVDKFIPNPFQTEEERNRGENSRLYNTGDLVKMHFDGNVEYIGRNDSQIKIRGYRVELSEIESALLSYPGIKQAVILVVEDSVGNESVADKNLVAYYVADKAINKSSLKRYMADRLSSYMLPGAWMQIDDFPLSQSGKIDSKKLAKPVFTDGCQYEDPTNQQEYLICRGFEQVLGIKRVGIDNDFFSLGGDSIKAIRLISILRDQFVIKAADIFSLRTPRRLAARISFDNNSLKQNLEHIKLIYQYSPNMEYDASKHVAEGMTDYFDDSNHLSADEYLLQKPIVNVLLTGATGFLGCNLLNQLLELTTYNIFLLVRAKDREEAVSRIDKKFRFYFGKDIADVYNKRVFVIKGDIEKDDLGLEPDEYKILVDNIDSIIHAAALTKHYGSYDNFFAANVQATTNLLELSKLTYFKDFHYISTVSALNYRFIKDTGVYIYTEDDFPEDPENEQDVYFRTKTLGEHQVVKYRKQGVKGNIYPKSVS